MANNNNNNNNNNWKRIGGFSRTGTQNYVRTSDAAMGGTTFGSTDVSYNTGNSTLRIGNNAGVVFINGDIDMSGGPGVGAPINRVRNVRDPIANQDVATKFYVDKEILSITSLSQIIGPPGAQGPPGIGFAGQNGSEGPTGATGCTGAIGPPGNVIGVLGPTGANGGTGATGTAGPAGATGPVGPIGAQGAQGTQGAQGIQGSNGTILWLNPDGDSTVNQLITDSYMLSTVPVVSTVRKVGPISVSATYGNTLKMIPGNRFWNTALKASTLAVIPSGVWVLNVYANVPSNSDANQVALYAAVFMITGTTNQPSPDSLIIETKDGGDAGYYPPRAAYLPDHVKYIGRSWTDVATTLTDKTSGAVIDSTTRKLYKIEMPVEFTTLKDASGNTEHVYLQLQIYIKNTTAANQTANVNLYYQTDLNTNETTYSYLQTTFGAVGIQGIQGLIGADGKTGSTGSMGIAGAAGPTGSVGPTGNTGAKGPQGDVGPTGPTGPAGQSNSVGRQYTVQYRSNAPQGGPTDDSDVSGSFAGNANFRFIPNPPGYTTNASDATTGTVVLNDLACKSIHSSFYIEDPSITGTSTRPRTFVKGGESTGGYIVLASGKNTTDGGTTSSPGTVADITHGFKLVHNIVGNPPTVAFNLHDNNKTTAKIGMKFDLTTGNIIAANDRFCVVNQSGAVGVGGMTPGEMTAVGQSGLNRALHVCGNVMVGTNPAAGATEASSAMILLNKATTTPSTAPLSLYPGVYHRSIASGETAALGGVTNSITTDASGGLGIISPNFITFQTGSALGNNSVVINQAGDVSVTGRANLNGPVSVGKNFAAVTPHPSVAPNTTPNIDVSGIIHISTPATGYTDNPRIKLISNAINPNADIPSASTNSTANEIRGVNTSDNSGFLRLSAQTPVNSCIDLIGANSDANAVKFSNSVRISTAGVDRMVINGSGNVGIGTTVPGVRLDVAGAAKITGNLDMSSSGKIVNLVNPTNAQDAATRNYVDTRTTDMATNASVSSATAGIATTTAVNTAITTALGASGTQNNRPTVYRNDSINTHQYLTFIDGNYLPTSDGGEKRALLSCDNFGPRYIPYWNLLCGLNYIGIGTNAPAFPLEINNTVSNVFGSSVHYLYDSATTGDNLVKYGQITSNISIKTSGSIWMNGTHLIYTSDQRIKTNIVSLNADKMMNVFRTLRPISFDFIDPIKNNNKKHFGFIAQEVKEVLPEGISINTDVIPNNMMKGGITKPSETDEEPHITLKPDDTDITLQYLLVTTDSPLKFDTANPYSSTNVYKFKVYCGKEWAKENDIYIRSDYNVTDDKYIYVIGMKKDVYDVAIIEPTLFVYGQYVYDLHILEHDTIYTVATAALQEVDREQQADKARIAELEATVSIQQSLINDILGRLKSNGM